MYILEVQPSFFVCWFPNHYCCFCRSLITIQEEPPMFKWWLTYRDKEGPSKNKEFIQNSLEDTNEIWPIGTAK